MNQRFVFAAVVGASALIAADAEAGIAYGTVGSTYSEWFNKLPSDQNDNSNIEDVYPVGWQDDVPDYSTTPAGEVSVNGWHLYYPILTTSEGGFNDHQRFRMGTGQNTGSFWGFANSSDLGEKALGSIGSTTTAANGAFFYMGLQLVNNTGQTLNSFTVTYDGEQWRDGQATTGETLSFSYSLDATDADWFTQPGTTPLNFTDVAALNFTAPTTAGTNSSGTAIDGNAAANRVDNITATITDITWAPGQELWLRWGDPQLASAADDGLAIDDVAFVATVPEPTGLASLALGAIGLAARRRSR